MHFSDSCDNPSLPGWEIRFCAEYTRHFAAIMVEFLFVCFHLSTCHTCQVVALMNIEDCHRILGIHPGSSLDEMQQDYRGLVKQRRTRENEGVRHHNLACPEKMDSRAK